MTHRRPRRRPRSAWTMTALAGLVAAVAATFAMPARPLASGTLPGNVLPGLPAPQGSTAPATPVEVAVTIGRPDPAGEQALYQAVHRPGDPLYRHFLNPDQFAQRFGVPPSRVQAVRDWATREGLRPVSVTRSGELLVLAGSAQEVERTFSVHLFDFRSDGLSYFANVDAPTVPDGLGIAGVVGLNSKLRSHLIKHHAAAAAPPKAAQDTCLFGNCLGLTTPQDLWSMYHMPPGNRGQGQRMAILGEGQTDPVITNLRAFERANGLPATPVSVVRVDGPAADYSDNTGEVEWDMDTQASTGMAPDVAGEVLYFGKDLLDASVLNAMSGWADDPAGPLQASASYGECEQNAVGPLSASATYTAAAEAALLKANLEGRTLFAATGDTGSSCPVVPANLNGLANEAYPVVEYPASSPHATAVGGTVLEGTGGSQPARAREYAWPYTGGGTSVTFPRPAYQDGIAAVTGVCVTRPAQGRPCRGVPDVAAQSGDLYNGYAIYRSGPGGTPQSGVGGGTSLSSPLILGMWARVQAGAPAVVSGGVTTYPGNGFANETLYRQYRGPARARDLFDIGGAGAASPPTSNGAYVSTPGWDYLSGVGVPDVGNLIADVDGAAVSPTMSGGASAVYLQGVSLLGGTLRPADGGQGVCEAGPVSTTSSGTVTGAGAGGTCSLTTGNALVATATAPAETVTTGPGTATARSQLASLALLPGLGTGGADLIDAGALDAQASSSCSNAAPSGHSSIAWTSLLVNGSRVETKPVGDRIYFNATGNNQKVLYGNPIWVNPSGGKVPMAIVTLNYSAYDATANAQVTSPVMVEFPAGGPLSALIVGRVFLSYASAACR